MNQYDQIKGGKTKKERQKDRKKERQKDEITKDRKLNRGMKRRQNDRKTGLCGDGEGSSKKLFFRNNS